MALVEYCDAEPTALIEANRDIAEALVSALIEAGTQGGDEVGEILASPQSRRGRWKPYASVAQSQRRYVPGRCVAGGSAERVAMFNLC